MAGWTVKSIKVGNFIGPWVAQYVCLGLCLSRMACVRCPVHLLTGASWHDAFLLCSRPCSGCQGEMRHWSKSLLSLSLCSWEDKDGNHIINKYRTLLYQTQQPESPWPYRSCLLPDPGEPLTQSRPRPSCHLCLLRGGVGQEQANASAETGCS